MKHLTDKEIVAKHRAAKWGSEYRSVGDLRYAARLAHLDGRTAMAKEWNRRASRLAKLVPNVQQYS